MGRYASLDPVLLCFYSKISTFARELNNLEPPFFAKVNFVVVAIYSGGNTQSFTQRGATMKFSNDIIVFLGIFFIGFPQGAIAKKKHVRGKPFANLQEQIDNIELTPGPQGPPGPAGRVGCSVSIYMAAIKRVS